MKNLTIEQVDELIMELESLKQQSAAIRERRNEIREMLPEGRVSGTDFDIRRGVDTYTSSFDASRLRRYVTSSLLDMCRVRRKVKGSITVVSKPKQKRAK